ncbi:MAG: SUF system NifU family Fe-S cluster assembly protein [Bacilli bacterium]|nr:SUF system NifU family Fe-S cluster assembly protein [Bacilli bacterium]
MDENLRREIILDNYQEPMNRGLISDDSYLKVNTSSESCIDNLDFMMKIEDGIVKDIRFDGEACAISTSATSIMIRSLIGKKLEDVKEILSNYQKMINEEEYNKEILEELNVYDTICKQPNRKNCALLPSVAVSKMLGELGK